MSRKRVRRTENIVRDDDTQLFSWEPRLALLEKVIEIMRREDEDIDFEALWKMTDDDGPEDIFREIFHWHDYREGDRPVGTMDCGGHKFDDTPLMLYRLLYLARPAHVPFDDMYKSGSLIDITSPDGHFLASFQFYKYEGGVYFQCSSDFHRAGADVSGIFGGWPGADNGYYCSSMTGQRWFDTFVRALETRWRVYPGNHFVV